MYQRLIASWNRRNAKEFASQFADDCICIGYDGSEMHGRSLVETQLEQIFKGYMTAKYVTIVREVKEIGDNTMLLHALVGMVTPNSSKVDPGKNAVQIMIAQFKNNTGRIILFQNTPAQYHGRPEALHELTQSLQQLADRQP